MVRVGDVVTIYELPAERRHPEGRARLTAFLDRGANGFTHWRVEFLDRPGAGCHRTLHGAETDEAPTWFRGRQNAHAGVRS